MVHFVADGASGTLPLYPFNVYTRKLILLREPTLQHNEERGWTSGFIHTQNKKSLRRFHQQSSLFLYKCTTLQWKLTANHHNGEETDNVSKRSLDDLDVNLDPGKYVKKFSDG